MSLADILTAASLGLSAAAGVHAAPASTAHGAAVFAGRGHGAGPADPSGLRGPGRPFFTGAGRGWGGAGWRHRHRAPGNEYAYSYPYWGFPFGDTFDTGYAEASGPGGPGPYGPPPPYSGFGPSYRPPSRPLARAPAPSVYGPGPHDGAYAYGYNGYAQTPSLTAYDP